MSNDGKIGDGGDVRPLGRVTPLRPARGPSDDGQDLHRTEESGALQKKDSVEISTQANAIQAGREFCTKCVENTAPGEFSELEVFQKLVMTTGFRIK